MFNTIIVAFLSIIIIITSSCNKHNKLKGTEWLVVRFSIDSSNYLTDLDKKAYLSFDRSTKLHIKFLDSLAFSFVEGAAVDTSIYEVKKDTLFFIQGPRKDTTIILKLTNDSLVDQRLAGVKTYSIRIKN
jgi:hypothetical protein